MPSHFRSVALRAGEFPFVYILFLTGISFFNYVTFSVVGAGVEWGERKAPSRSPENASCTMNCYVYLSATVMTGISFHIPHPSCNAFATAV